ncbi:MAG: hypothetical protein H7Z19_00230 [Chitinophagaceae bacterium]|nr:hypothetical protein [Rubrivivax sp.]
MATRNLTSFEVLSSPIAPGVPDVPYIQQGFFLQVTNMGPANAFLGVQYLASPTFVESKGAVKLFANVIDETGMPQQYPLGGFLGAPVGFEGLNVPAGATWLIGVQYLLLPPPAPLLDPATGSTPQDAAMARGVVRIDASAGTKWMMLATVRQVFSTYTPAGGLIEYDSAAYPVPLLGGPEQLF